MVARVRGPRDKSVAESAIDLVEQWIIGSAGEMTFYTIAELNEFCAERTEWLSACPLTAKDGSRESVFEEERMHLIRVILDIAKLYYEMRGMLYESLI